MFNYVGTPLLLEDLESRTLNHGRFYKLDDMWVPSVKENSCDSIGHKNFFKVIETEDEEEQDNLDFVGRDDLF